MSEFTLMIAINQKATVPEAGCEPLQSLIATLAAISPHMRGHGDRVREHTLRMIGQLSPADPTLAELARLTSLLHDLGKLAIHSELLERAGPLTHAEFAYVQRHAGIGANILECVAPGHPVAAAVRHHHEWWNGNGYPDGISGTDIPLVSRIVAVADSFDAMTSPRSYRSAVPPADANTELVRCSGTQFDPAVVQAVIEVAAR